VAADATHIQAQVAARGRSGGPGAPPGSTGWPGFRRRINTPRVLLGAAVILTCALAGAVIAGRADARVAVLATSHALPVGHALTERDLVVVRVAAGSGVATVPASRRAAVLGRTLAVPLPPATLLADAQLGRSAAWPPAGRSVVAVPVKPGHAPAGLTPGARVTVLVVPAGTDADTSDDVDDGATAGGGVDGAVDGGVVMAEATVVDVSAAADQSGVTVISVLMAASDAAVVAAAPGEASIVQRAGRG